MLFTTQAFSERFLCKKNIDVLHEVQEFSFTFDKKMLRKLSDVLLCVKLSKNYGRFKKTHSRRELLKKLVLLFMVKFSVIFTIATKKLSSCCKFGLSTRSSRYLFENSRIQEFEGKNGRHGIRIYFLCSKFLCFKFCEILDFKFTREKSSIDWKYYLYYYNKPANNKQNKTIRYTA